MRYYINLLCEEQTAQESCTRRFFHITPHSRITSILKNGLMPGRRRQWRNSFGARLGDRSKLYLFSEMDPAIQLAARMEWDTKRPVDILEIALPCDVAVDPDPHIEAQMQPGTWWTTEASVSPDAIVKVMPLTVEMKRDFIARRDAR